MSTRSKDIIAIPNARPSSGITNHDPDTASSDRRIPAAACWRIAVHVFSPGGREEPAGRGQRADRRQVALLGLPPALGVGTRLLESRSHCSGAKVEGSPRRITAATSSRACKLRPGK
jgi:hypothetical protein